MLAATQLSKRQVQSNWSRQARHVIRIEGQHRKYWTSAANIKTKGDIVKFTESSVVKKYNRIMIPDFANLNFMDSRQLFQEFRKLFPPETLQLIVASSNNEKNIDYGQLTTLLAETPGLDSTLVVKGSGIHALANTRQVREQYIDTIRAVRTAGCKVMMPLRIDQPELVVLRDIERRLHEGATGFVTHPVFDVSAVSPQVVKMLRAIAKEHPDFRIRTGALWVSEEWYDRVASKGGQLVTAGGLDQYPMRAKPADGDWERWNVENLRGIGNLVESLNLRQSMTDSTYTRWGLGHSEESVRKIATVMEEYIRELGTSL
jgi:hypothetical protein